MKLEHQKSFDDIQKEVAKLRTSIQKNAVKMMNINNRLPEIINQIDSSAEATRLVVLQKRFRDVMSKIKNQKIYGYIRDLYQTNDPAAEFILQGAQYNVVTEDFNSIEMVLHIVKQAKLQLQFLPIQNIVKQNSMEQITRQL